MERAFFTTACVLAATLFTSSCQKEVTQNEVLPAVTSEATATSTTDEMAKAVRQATSRFNSVTQAIKAGYEPGTHCVPNMGYHWAKPSNIDPVFNPLEPEALLYAQWPGGNLKLVAVEYIVIDIGQPAPMFGDEPFNIGGTPVPGAHWSLHVWLHHPNPSGKFMPTNPNIACH